MVVLQGEFLGFYLVTHAGVGIERRGAEEGVELLEHLTTLEEDGCQTIGLLLTGRGVVIDYLLDDEGEGAPYFTDAHAVLGQLSEYMLMKERDVLCLGLYILGGLDGMKISVDEYLSLVEVAQVEGGCAARLVPERVPLPQTARHELPRWLRSYHPHPSQAVGRGRYG